MKRPNPLQPDRMTPVERRTELCGLLAQGLVRLNLRNEARSQSKSENVDFTSRPTNAVMQLRPTGETHDRS